MLDYPLELVARVLEARVVSPKSAPTDAIVRRVCTDSRQIQPGDLFFALSGENFDGHKFVADALERGAVGAVVQADRGPKSPRSGPRLEVADPLLALGQLAAWHRNRFSVQVVAVTGSVGKTTTKDLIHSILSQQSATLKSPGNLNAEIGLPLTLFELGTQHRAAVVELAMRGPGQIRYLARIARPDVAVITNIGLSHLELLGSQEGIAEAKAELLDFLPHGGSAVLNADDRFCPFLRERVPAGVQTTFFGMDTATGVTGDYLGPGYAEGKERSPERVMGSRFILRTAKGQKVRPAWIPLLGRHNLRNALAAAAVAQALGVSWPRIHRGLAEAEISGMRMAVHRLRDGSFLLDDAYNASSPEAMFAALEVLGETSGLRKLAVLGDMLELGPATDEAHDQVGDAVAKLRPSFLITVGAHARRIAERAVGRGMSESQIATCATNSEALVCLQERRRPGDVILVKGSRGVAMESIVRELRGG